MSIYFFIASAGVRPLRPVTVSLKVSSCVPVDGVVCLVVEVPLLSVTVVLYFVSVG